MDLKRLDPPISRCPAHTESPRTAENCPQFHYSTCLPVCILPIQVSVSRHPVSVTVVSRSIPDCRITQPKVICLNRFGRLAPSRADIGSHALLRLDGLLPLSGK